MNYKRAEILLAGGDRTPLQKLTTPKQFCGLTGDSTLLEHILSRVARLPPISRTAGVSNQEHCTASQRLQMPKSGKISKIINRPSSRRIGNALIIAIRAICPPQPPFHTKPVTPVVRPTSSVAPGAKVVKASWYGAEFAWKKTSREIYNSNGLTAASKDFAFGFGGQGGESRKRTLCAESGLMIVVPIPEHSIDLSRRAAQKLGIVNKGVAPVKLEPIAASSPEP